MKIPEIKRIIRHLKNEGEKSSEIDHVAKDSDASYRDIIAQQDDGHEEVDHIEKLDEA